MKQLDIFGNEIDIEEINQQIKKQRFNRLSIKGIFRRMHGYDQNNNCRDCIYCICYRKNRNYYKCKKIGISSSEATDIRLRDCACDLFERKDESNGYNM